MVSPHVDLGPDVDFDFGQRPGAGRYRIISTLLVESSLLLHTHSSCLLANPLYAQAIREKSVIQLFDHLQSIHSRCSDTEVCSLMFHFFSGAHDGKRRESEVEDEGALAREYKPRTKHSLVNRREQDLCQACLRQTMRKHQGAEL